MDEQARELSFEGDRWYFLKRLGILIEQIKAYAGDPEIPASILGRNNLPANPHFVRWPIPKRKLSIWERKLPSKYRIQIITSLKQHTYN